MKILEHGMKSIQSQDTNTKSSSDILTTNFEWIPQFFKCFHCRVSKGKCQTFNVISNITVPDISHKLFKVITEWPLWQLLLLEFVSYNTWFINLVKPWPKFSGILSV